MIMFTSVFENDENVLHYMILHLNLGGDAEVCALIMCVQQRGFRSVVCCRLGLNEFLQKFLVELHRDSGLFLQSFSYFQEGLFNETPLNISRRTHSIQAWVKILYFSTHLTQIFLVLISNALIRIFWNPQSIRNLEISLISLGESSTQGQFSIEKLLRLKNDAN